MNKYFFRVLFVSVIITFNSCRRDDDTNIEPPRDFATQYLEEKPRIEEFLNTYYLEVTNAPGTTADMDVSIKRIPVGGNQTRLRDLPNLVTREVTIQNVTYTLYFIRLREGNGSHPTNLDGVFTSYTGYRLFKATEDNNGQQTTFENLVQFETVVFPQSILRLDGVIRGWSEIFPQFKTGSFTENTDGTISYNDFGAGILIVPSALGYYNQVRANIPAYSPLVFSFKLYQIQRLDQDNDKILSYLEDIDGDRYMLTLATGVVNPDDTDGDGVPNCFDTDDDNDGRLTRNELNLDSSGNPILPHPDCDSDGIPDYLDADPCQ